MATETEVARAIAAMLIADAAHGQAIASLTAIGEITLRDATVVAVAAVGARLRQAWIIDREVVPSGWSDAAVDVLINTKGNNGTIHLAAGIEWKWWRRSDLGNASNRRRDLVRDYFRAAALYQAANEFALVALLSTPDSWNATTGTHGADKPIVDRLKASGVQSWSLAALKKCPSLVGAAKSLSGKVPVTSSFRTELLAHTHLTSDGLDVAQARVWAVRKPKRSKLMTSDGLKSVFA